MSQSDNHALQETLVPITMIAAVSQNRVIGAGGGLPWSISEDLKFFKAATLHKPLIMGRATFESIGRALPDRINIVVSRNPHFEHPDLMVCRDLASAIALADDQAMMAGVEEIMICGGGDIYAQLLPVATRLYLTEIGMAVEGDTFFPELDAGWHEMERVAGSPGKGQPAFDFVRYERL